MDEQIEKKDVYINRELSWLAFNKRVLRQSIDKQVPVLERLKFLSIYSNNLDEFFMVRVALLNDIKQANPKKRDQLTNMSIDEQLVDIFKEVRDNQGDVEQNYKKLVQNLKNKGIKILDKRWTKLEETVLNKYFKDSVKPLLSPSIISPYYGFPFLRNKGNYILVSLEKNEKSIKTVVSPKKAPKTVYGMVSLNYLPTFAYFEIDGNHTIIPMSTLVNMHISGLFKQHKVKESCYIRVTRNAASLKTEEEYESYVKEDFRNVMQTILKERKRLGIIRVQISNSISEDFEKYICSKLDITPDLCFYEKSHLNPKFAFEVYAKLAPQFPNLLYKPYNAPNAVHGKEHLIDFYANQDVLVSYPYHSSSSFTRLIYDAANDPRVKSIKISLYRLANPSRLVDALMLCAEKNKDVTCILELRARFDEQSNIDYAKVLEHSGCKVFYGLPGYKMHSKICLITYVHNGNLKSISYIGTGNFNEETQKLYTDLSYITSDPIVGKDVSNIFTTLALGEFVTDAKKLWVAPLLFKTRFMELIDQEIEYQKNYGDGEIFIKANSMNDPEIMEKLIEASQANVKVFLSIRGICCLKAGVKGYTENITIQSVIGRYLEHSRIFKFNAHNNPVIYIGSGDLLTRNTENRVETFIPILDSKCYDYVNAICEMEKNYKDMAWLQDNGKYSKPDEQSEHLQELLKNYFSNISFEDTAVKKKRSFFTRLLELFGFKK